MDNLAITDEELAIVKAILNEFVPDLPVWAFGSRVKGTARKYSDLDLAIISNDPIGISTYASLKEAFSESDLVWKVDIVDWATTSKSFREIIKSKYIQIQ